MDQNCIELISEQDILNAQDALFSAKRIRLVDRAGISPEPGVMLREDAAPHPPTPFGEPDLIFHVTIDRPGRYRLVSCAATCGSARQKMKNTLNKFDSLRIMLAIDADFARSRVIVSPWQNQDRALQELGVFDWFAGDHLLKIQLPAEVILDRIVVEPHLPPTPPIKARRYNPPVLPAAAHPRIWITPETLPQIRANLEKPEHRPVWEEVKRGAEKVIELEIAPNTVVGHLPQLLETATLQAFVHVVAGDRETGKKAVRLMRDYMTAVEFDNMLDITRELGEVIYAGARVYDWCYDLMTDAERTLFRRKLLKLAEGMEIGWPPFGQPVVNGHGNEAQVCRDLLAYAIAVYGEDNEPYRYCSYLMLKELAPLRNFEYRCDRHNQGVGYGAYRFAYEMHGVSMLRRMCGREVFAGVIKNVYNFWLYYRQPDHRLLEDGDGNLGVGPWHAPLTAFMCAAYSGNPIIKGDFLRQGGRINDPTLFLALNDPDLKPVTTLAGLPQTHYFRGVIGSMIARTGWDFSEESADVVVEMKGGGYNFGNHQHADAGNFQIFYRGRLATDLGLYGFYGTSYDFGYNKRSICHNVMLAFDPAEKVHRDMPNDGGQRFSQQLPLTPEMLLTDPWFHTGRTLGADFGPSPDIPAYSYLKTDLAPAYTKKISYYTRTFCFVRLGLPGHPAALIVIDRMTTADPSFRKYWLLNTLTAPEPTGRGIRVCSNREKSPGKMELTLLLPHEFETKIQGGPDSTDVFGVKLESPRPERPESNGFRTMFSPKGDRPTDLFISLMQIGDHDAGFPAAGFVENRENGVIALPGWVLALGTSERPAEAAFTVEIPAGTPDTALLAADLAPGDWRIDGGGVCRTCRVEPDQGTLFTRLPAGSYRLSRVENESRKN